MKEIFTLIRFDLKLSRELIQYYILLISAFVISAVFLKNIPANIFILCYWTLTLYYIRAPFTVCHENNLEAFYSILGINGKRIVTSRYIFYDILQTFGFLLAIFLIIILSTFFQINNTLKEATFILSFLTAFFSLLTAIKYPFYFKLGYKNGFDTAINFIGFVIFIPLLLYFLHRINYEDYGLLFGTKKMNSLDVTAFSFTSIFISIIMLIASYILSCKFYKIREI